MRCVRCAAVDLPQILRRVYQPLRGPDLCHTEVVKCIVVTETGKIMSGGYVGDPCTCRNVILHACSGVVGLRDAWPHGCLKCGQGPPCL